ncbi:sensor histidine kinase [Desulfobacula sp.]|uniref:sensor histidine kinase n=1 Tax=Desulfobacula sp. TaxID=2593537 RepID=UPI0026101C3E|nr:sensor histidine kinase [Desulfobacula sp.]
MPDRSFTISATRDFPYYRKVWKKVVAILIASAFLPLAIIGGGMYVYLARTIKHKTMEALQAEAVSHKRDIDSFLTERIMDLKLISENNGLSKMMSPGAIEQVLSSLQRELPCFQDLGVIGADGEHLAYTGPYDLKAKNYRNTVWFKAVMDDGVSVSDVFTGFRNVPHFIIAVKRNEGKTLWILRATVMSSLFDNIVTQLAGNTKADAYLINSKGDFQTNARKGGELMMKSQVLPPGRFKGVQVEEKGTTLTLTTWLETVSWLSVVSIDTRDLFEDSRRVRNMGLFVILLGGFVIILSILFTTDSLVSMLEEKRKNNRRLDLRLRRAAFLASLMKLSKGVFSDLTDILSNIHVTGTLMKEQIGLADVCETDLMAEQIFSEAIRGRNLIDSFIRFAGPEDPVIMAVDIHMMLDHIIVFLRTALIEKNIGVITDFQAGFPTVRSDGNALCQVLLTLLVNAASAVSANGSIFVSTSMKENGVMILISDDGPGLGKADMEYLFEPQYSTDRGDSGFGLSISRDIMERIGGRISVRNGEEHGAVFEVQVPGGFVWEYPDAKGVIPN